MVLPFILGAAAFGVTQGSEAAAKSYQIRSYDHNIMTLINSDGHPRSNSSLVCRNGLLFNHTLVLMN